MLLYLIYRIIVVINSIRSVDARKGSELETPIEVRLIRAEVHHETAMYATATERRGKQTKEGVRITKRKPSFYNVGIREEKTLQKHKRATLRTYG